MAPTGAIFGALHLIPIWLSGFPSGVGKTLWQVSAIVITATPTITALSLMAMTTYDDKPGPLNEIIFILAGILVLATFVAYAAARVILLVLCFTTLRSLPPEAFLSVEWTRFIPHF
jgi:hypothetical protein